MWRWLVPPGAEVQGAPTVDFIRHHDARDLGPELPQLCVPGAQVPVRDFPLHVEHLQAEGGSSASPARHPQPARPHAQGQRGACPRGGPGLLSTEDVPVLAKAPRTSGSKAVFKNVHASSTLSPHLIEGFSQMVNFFLSVLFLLLKLLKCLCNNFKCF